jgi:hypothetical protein
MTNRKQVISTLFAAFLFALSLTNVSAQGRGAVSEAQRITGDTFRISTRTPKGANIYSVNRPSAAMLQAIDRGLSDLFVVAQRNGYRRHLNYADYTIFIGRADRTKNAAGAYSPDIAVGAAQYAGTQYDQGGYIYAAGMVVANSPASFVIAEHTANFSRVSDVVRYEGEHLVLFYNDRQRYEATKDHSKGGSHPILQ